MLNLGEMNYIDSGGLGTLVAFHTTAHTAGTIKLANLTKRVGDFPGDRVADCIRTAQLRVRGAGSIRQAPEAPFLPIQRVHPVDENARPGWAVLVVNCAPPYCS